MYSSDYGNTASQNGFSQDSSLEERPNTSTVSALTTRESVELFHEAMATARGDYHKTAIGSDTASEALKSKLTVDLRRRGLSQLPKEVISIIKQDVERYDSVITIAKPLLIWYCKAASRPQFPQLHCLRVCELLRAKVSQFTGQSIQGDTSSCELPLDVQRIPTYRLTDF